MKQYVTQYGQSLIDIALQEYGHIDGVFQIIKDNPQYAITDVPKVGDVVLIQKTVPVLSLDNNKIAETIKSDNITMASGLNTNLQRRTYVEAGYLRRGYIQIQ